MANSPRANKALSAREIARFLARLAATGNLALACASIGRAKSGLYKRRARDPAFAAECEAAVVRFRLSAAGEPASVRPERSRGGQAPLKTDPGALALSTHRGLPQLRRSPAGRLTRAGLQAFLNSLAATANVRLAARSVGVAASSIYYRRRADHRFAEAMNQALSLGYHRLEAALLQHTLDALDGLDGEAPLSSAGEGGLGPGSTRAEPGEGTTTQNPISFHDALMLLRLHRRRVKDGWASFQKQYEAATTAEIVKALERRLRTFDHEMPSAGERLRSNREAASKSH